jgi:hypothetical protein
MKIIIAIDCYTFGNQLKDIKQISDAVYLDAYYSMVDVIEDIVDQVWDPIAIEPAD